MLLSEFIDIIEGRLICDGEFELLEYCTSNCNSFFLTFLENIKFIDRLNKKISCIITTKDMENIIPKYIKGIIIVDEPKKEFIKIHNFLADNGKYVVDEFETKVGENCNISPLAYISEKNVRIGNDVVIGPFTVINENVFIGDRCKIYGNCVIGGKGFNYARTKNGEILGMKDLGKVIVEDDVEIYPMCHIAKGPFPTDITRIGKNVKLDALIHVGHGTRIGDRTEIPAGAQIGGNCTIGEDAWVGVNATVANRMVIGNQGRVSLGAVVTQNVEDGQTVTGNFAVEHSRFLKELREANKKAEAGKK